MNIDSTGIRTTQEEEGVEAEERETNEQSEDKIAKTRARRTHRLGALRWKRRSQTCPRFPHNSSSSFPPPLPPSFHLLLRSRAAASALSLPSIYGQYSRAMAGIGKSMDIQTSGLIHWEGVVGELLHFSNFWVVFSLSRHVGLISFSLLLLQSLRNICHACETRGRSSGSVGKEYTCHSSLSEVLGGSRVKRVCARGLAQR